ncbi:hypothetical protein NL399_27735, partial [Klebsiella pneumoniae]|nr:hypothetical protein [Klebsiella pneumoniae]
LPFTEWHIVKQAGVARANIAQTEASFDGSTDNRYNSEHSHQTVCFPTFFHPRMANCLFHIGLIHRSFSSTSTSSTWTATG